MESYQYQKLIYISLTDFFLLICFQISIIIYYTCKLASKSNSTINIHSQLLHFYLNEGRVRKYE